MSSTEAKGKRVFLPDIPQKVTVIHQGRTFEGSYICPVKFCW